jgi:hypothetical protein
LQEEHPGPFGRCHGFFFIAMHLHLVKNLKIKSWIANSFSLQPLEVNINISCQISDKKNNAHFLLSFFIAWPARVVGIAELESGMWAHADWLSSYAKMAGLSTLFSGKRDKSAYKSTLSFQDDNNTLSRGSLSNHSASPQTEPMSRLLYNALLEKHERYCEETDVNVQLFLGATIRDDSHASLLRGMDDALEEIQSYLISPEEEPPFVTCMCMYTVA